MMAADLAATGAVERRTSVRPFGILIAVVGLVGWAAVVWLAQGLLASGARNVGFDLSLILAAGRAVAEGRTPYSAEMLAGGAPEATTLFFSYPPPIAQAAALVHGVPLLAAVAVLGAAGALGLGAVGEAVRRRWSPDAPRWLAGAAVVAAAPYWLPFTTAVLFGNLDVLFPFLLGLGALAAVTPATAAGVRAVGGVAVALAAVTKLYPGGLGLWFLVRAARERRRRESGGSWIVVAAAVATGIVVLVVSVAVGGVQPWADYATVVRAASASPVVDPRNAGPAAQLALVLGLGEGTARLLHLPVAAGAVLLTIWAAWTRDDPLEGIAWATVASIVLLPITWYHYPAVLLPLLVAALVRARANSHGLNSVVRTAIAALVVIDVAIVFLALVWAAAGLVLVAIRLSAPGTSERPKQAESAA